MASAQRATPQQLDVGNRLGARQLLLASVESVTRVLAAADHDQRAATLQSQQHLAREQEHGVAALQAPGKRVAAALRALGLRHFGELGNALGRKSSEGRERGELCRAGFQNSSTRLFCSMRGRKVPAHSSISSMVGSISPGLRCVM